MIIVTVADDQPVYPRDCARVQRRHDSRIAEIDGRFIWFDVSLSDGVDLIGEGRHKRAVTRWDKFNAKVAAKAARAEQEMAEN